MSIPLELADLGVRVSYAPKTEDRRVGEIRRVQRFGDDRDPISTVRFPDRTTMDTDLRGPQWHLIASQVEVTPDGVTAGPFDGVDIIGIYTRAQALEDGTLVDVSSVAREAGFTVPVALTRAAWSDCVEWTESNRATQDESGRLWDVLSLARFHGRRMDGDRISFRVLRVPNRDSSTRATYARLVAVVGPGDTAAPVITIMCEGED